MNQERRAIKGSEVRVEGTGATARIVGYAARFNQPSQDLGGFIEVIAAGAFSSVLSENQDVRGLYNHNPDHILARTKSGTMKLFEDEIGLRYEMTPPDTQLGRDLLVSVGRGDIDGASFGFSIGADGDRWEMKGEVITRTLLRIKTLYDVGPVTYPAYLSATSDVATAKRSLDTWRTAQTTGMHWSVAQAKLNLAKA